MEVSQNILPCAIQELCPTIYPNEILQGFLAGTSQIVHSFIAANKTLRSFDDINVISFLVVLALLVALRCLKSLELWT